MQKWRKHFLILGFVSAAMDMKAVKEENAEEEDDDVPGRDVIVMLIAFKITRWGTDILLLLNA